ncbi:MAG TPA: DegT/DnrJ/EryC1/StrS family aminotransferase, partial [Candidatus Solibacter sp.]|nr:DegT/DnrJ/EryC1/StrS family aminotransferase [Candidatus Solibacter sp.]
APFALALNSCTAALHLALAALEIGPVDEVITTPLTFCATVNCILHTGATPVMADIGPDGNIDPASIRQRITSRTRALMPVHYGGLPCDMRSIWKIARDRGLYVIEDAAHALGARYEGSPIGAGSPTGGLHSDEGLYSDAVAFSFYATKSLAIGEGGMVTCHNEDLLERMRVLCLHGIGKDAWNRYGQNGSWYYEVVAPGFKYNMSDIQSSIGIAQLRKQERFVAIRAAHARFYAERLAGVEEVELPEDAPVSNHASRHAWHLYPIRLNLDRLKITRGDFIEKLKKRGVGASVHFIPIPLHPAYAHLPQAAPESCPKAIELYERLVSLPIYPDLSRGELEHIASSVKAIVRAGRRTRVFAAASQA